MPRPKTKKKTKPRKPKTRQKLSHKDSWGYHLYTFGRKEIDYLSVVEISGKKYKVYAITDSTTVYDMGHNGPVSSYRYYVTIDFAGVRANIYLDEIIREGAKIYPVKYDLVER